MNTLIVKACVYGYDEYYITIRRYRLVRTLSSHTYFGTEFYEMKVVEYGPDIVLVANNPVNVGYMFVANAIDIQD